MLLLSLVGSATTRHTTQQGTTESSLLGTFEGIFNLIVFEPTRSERRTFGGWNVDPVHVALCTTQVRLSLCVPVLRSARPTLGQR
jgi:hypothetical protein